MSAMTLALVLMAGASAERGGFGVWERLKRFDADGDGRVTRDEFGGPARFFDRMDADGDGAVTEKEARSVRRGFPGRQGRPSPLLGRIDADRDGRISREEWDAFFARADRNRDKILEREEWDEALRGRGGGDTAPRVGDRAPAVTAKRLTDGTPVDLAHPRRTTVLVFGSYT